MRILDATAVTSLGYAAAVRAITDALRSGVDPATDPARTPVDLTNGQFLLMPSQTPDAAGVKVVTVAPGNPSRGLPRIQAAYLLFDADTLALRSVVDGTALTTLRTPAVSVAAVLNRLPQQALRVAIIGGGPQAVGHVAALSAVRPVDNATYLVRDPNRAHLENVLALGGSEAAAVLSAADVVVCATSARSPLFNSALLRDDVVVIAVGSHEPQARELDAALFGRANVVVEDVATALREAGDIVLAISDGTLQPADLIPMRAVVSGSAQLSADRPLVFKSVGMSWEDLVVATALMRHADD